MTFIIDGTAGATFPNSTTQASAGVVLQVVQATSASNTSTTSSTFSATALTATITPKFSNSKILILSSFTAAVVGNSPANAGYALYRNNTTQLIYNSYTENGSNNINYLTHGESANYLDSPATTSATTYTIYYRAANGGTAYINSGSNTSVITLLEIAG